MSLPALGIDIAKSKFDACLLREGKLRHKIFPNNTGGFAQFSDWLRSLSVTQVHACMEATACYGDELAMLLLEAGHVVSVVNPARIKGYAQSQMLRNKTDKMDSTIIARFCQTQHPQPWAPPPAEMSQLQGLVRRVESLRQMRQQEANRLEFCGKNPAVSESLNKIIGLLDQEIETLKQLISEHIENHPRLKSERELLLSIPGIGETTATWLLSEININAYVSARQLAAHAGLTPQHKESGSSLRAKTRLSKTGNRRLRRALYMPAVVAKRFNSVIKAFCERLLKRGKHKMEIIGAAMRKLLHLVYGVLKSGKRFDPLLGARAIP
jgi:transposase